MHDQQDAYRHIAHSMSCIVACNVLLSSLKARRLSISYSRLVPPQLTSSYSGYGTSCLDQDAEEVDQLCRFLLASHYCTDVALVGHSTGCQIIVRFMQRQNQQKGHHVVGGGGPLPIRGTVLQAAVSDREYLASDEHREGMDRMASKAREMVKSGRGDDICCR